MSFFDAERCNWHASQVVVNRTFVCGYCGTFVASVRGYMIATGRDGSGYYQGGIHICPNCDGPTFLTPTNNQFPPPPMGNSVANLPDGLKDLYEEARRCTSQRCYTASVLICRKMLMNICVEQGASENLKFVQYVDFLSEKGFIPINARKWVDHIRKKGNEATHEIALMTEADAEELVSFTEMLLRIIYEFPRMIKD